MRTSAPPSMPAIDELTASPAADRTTAELDEPTGISADDFLRELMGETEPEPEPVPDAPVAEAPTAPPAPPAAPPVPEPTPEPAAPATQPIPEPAAEVAAPPAPPMDVAPPAITESAGFMEPEPAPAAPAPEPIAEMAPPPAPTAPAPEPIPEPAAEMAPLPAPIPEMATPPAPTAPAPEPISEPAAVMTPPPAPPAPPEPTPIPEPAEERYPEAPAFDALPPELVTPIDEPPASAPVEEPPTRARADEAPLFDPTLLQVAGHGSPAPPPADEPPAPTFTEPDLRAERAPSAAADDDDEVALAHSIRTPEDLAVGPSKGHGALTAAVTAAAVALLALGVLVTYQFGAADGPAEAAVEPVADAVEPLPWSLVTLELDGCGLLDTAVGIQMADGNILVSRSSVAGDTEPTIALPSGERFPSVVVGWSETRNIAVVRTDADLDGGLRWGISARLGRGDSVSIPPLDGAADAEPATAVIQGLAQVGGTTTAFELDIDGTVGAPVLAGDGRLVGVVSEPGIARVSDELAPAISRLVVDDERPAPRC